MPLALILTSEYNFIVDLSFHSVPGAPSPLHLCSGYGRAGHFLVAAAVSVSAGVANGMEGMAWRVLCAGMAALTGAMAEFAADAVAPRTATMPRSTKDRKASSKSREHVNIRKYLVPIGLVKMMN